MAEDRNRSETPREGVEEGLEEHIERIDETSRRLRKRVRAMGEMQRDPKRAMAEAPKARRRDDR